MNTLSSPLFSVVMPAYNAAVYIGEAIESVIAQEFDQWELIVVDDGSTDGTHDIATAYASGDDRIRVFEQPNSGTAIARNKAIDEARGEWCLMLDADDLLTPQCMSKFVDFFSSHPGLKFASCYAARLHPDGRVHRHLHHVGERVPKSATLRNMLHEVTIVLPGTCVETQVLRSIGGFRPDSYTEDVELWFSLLLTGFEHRFCADELAIWRVTAGSKSSQHVVFSEEWVRMLERLNGALIEELGLQRELRVAIHRAVSSLHLARLQEMVSSGCIAEQRRYVWAYRHEIEWTPANASRLMAALVAPGIYSHWLRRGGRRRNAVS